jgi:hypothetical protein
MKIAVSIAHAGHIAERKPLLERLLKDLGSNFAHVHVEGDKAPPHVWSERQWLATIRSGVTHGLFLNDDLFLCDHFAETLARVVEARPNDVISLYCSDERARHIVGRWYTSREGLIGNAYVVPIQVLCEFLAFRKRDLVESCVETLTEDQQLNLFCMATGRKVWHTRPSLVEHDVSIASCYGNEGNAARTAAIGPWKNMHHLDWTASAAPHLGRFFRGNHQYLLTALNAPAWRKYDTFNKYFEYHRDTNLSVYQEF